MAERFLDSCVRHRVNLSVQVFCRLPHAAC